MAMPPVTVGAQVMYVGVFIMAVGATLGTDAGALVELFGVAVGATLGTDDWAGEEETGGGEGDGIVVGICGGVGMLSGRAVCWRKMLLSWSSW
jgi:hypothetical protein